MSGVFANYPGIGKPTLPGVLPTGELSKGYGILNPGVQTLGAVGKALVNKYPGNTHGEWLVGTQDEALTHPGISAITQQLSTIVEFGDDVTRGRDKLYVEGELAWLYGFVDPTSIFSPGGALQYPRDMRDFKPESELVFGTRTVVDAYKLLLMQQRFLDNHVLTNADGSDRHDWDRDCGERVGSWFPQVFRKAWPLAEENVLDPEVVCHHITLAVGDSNQVRVPQDREDGNRNAKRLFNVVDAKTPAEERRAKALRVIWSKMLPNGRSVIPVGAKLFSVLAAYQVRSPGNERQIQLETHLFVDLTPTEIAVLSRLVATPSQRIDRARDRLGVQIDREGFHPSIDAFPTCQVISPVQYLGVITVAHYYGGGAGTVFVALEPTDRKSVV